MRGDSNRRARIVKALLPRDGVAVGRKRDRAQFAHGVRGAVRTSRIVGVAAAGHAAAQCDASAPTAVTRRILAIFP